MQLYSDGFTGDFTECLSHFFSTELLSVERVDRGVQFPEPLDRYGFRGDEVCQTLMFSNYSQMIRNSCPEDIFFPVPDGSKRVAMFITLRGVIKLMWKSKHPDCIVLQKGLTELLNHTLNTMFKNGHPVDAEHFQKTTGLFESAIST